MEPLSASFWKCISMHVDICPCDDTAIFSARTTDTYNIYVGVVFAYYPLHAFMFTDNTLDKRQQQAIELRQSTIRAQTMTDQELADLRADIKVQIGQWQALKLNFSTLRFLIIRSINYSGMGHST